MNLTGWALAVVGAFLVADALLALVFGRRYMLFGLESTPVFYRAFIVRLSSFPGRLLLTIKLAECSLGLFMFWFALNMI